MPAEPTRVIDTTGAGDAFNAGLAVALAHGSSFEEAVEFATVTGALAVTQSGAGSQVFGSSGGVTALMTGNNETLNGGSNGGNVAATLSGSGDVVGASNGAIALPMMAARL